MKQLTKIMPLFAAVALLTFMGCSNPFSPPSFNRGDAGLTITVATDEGRTLFPSAAFIRYELELQHSPSGTVVTYVIPTGDTSMTIQSLAAGSWSITAKGFVRINNIEYEAARGTDSVTVSPGSKETKVITISARNDTGYGYLTYSINYPESKVNYARLTWRNELISPGYTTIPYSGYTHTDQFPAGYYLVTATLETGYEVATKSEVVHIYANMETIAQFDFTDSDFTPVITLRGMMNATIGGSAPDYAFIYVYESDWSPIGYDFVVGNGPWSVPIPATTSARDIIIDVLGYKDDDQVHIDRRYISASNANVDNIIFDGDSAPVYAHTVALKENWDGTTYWGLAATEETRFSGAKLFENYGSIQAGYIYPIYYDFKSDRNLPNLLFNLVDVSGGGWNELSPYEMLNINNEWEPIVANRQYHGLVYLIVVDTITDLTDIRLNFCTGNDYGDYGDPDSIIATLKFSNLGLEPPDNNVPSLTLLYDSEGLITDDEGGYATLLPITTISDSDIEIQDGDEYILYYQFISNRTVTGSGDIGDGFVVFLADNSGASLVRLSSPTPLTTWGGSKTVERAKYFSGSVILTATADASNAGQLANMLAIVADPNFGTDNLTLYDFSFVLERYVPATYSISFVYNGGTDGQGQSNKNVTWTADVPLSGIIPTDVSHPSGKLLVGWFDLYTSGVNYPKYEYTGTDSFSTDVDRVLTAVWTDVPLPTTGNPQIDGSWNIEPSDALQSWYGSSITTDNGKTVVEFYDAGGSNGVKIFWPTDVAFNINDYGSLTIDYVTYAMQNSSSNADGIELQLKAFNGSGNTTDATVSNYGLDKGAGSFTIEGADFTALLGNNTTGFAFQPNAWYAPSYTYIFKMVFTNITLHPKQLEPDYINGYLWDNNPTVEVAGGAILNNGAITVDGPDATAGLHYKFPQLPSGFTAEQIRIYYEVTNATGGEAADRNTSAITFVSEQYKNGVAYPDGPGRITKSGQKTPFIGTINIDPLNDGGSGGITLLQDTADTWGAEEFTFKIIKVAFVEEVPNEVIISNVVNLTTSTTSGYDPVLITSPIDITKYTRYTITVNFYTATDGTIPVYPNSDWSDGNWGNVLLLIDGSEGASSSEPNLIHEQRYMGLTTTNADISFVTSDIGGIYINSVPCPDNFGSWEVTEIRFHN